MLNLNALGRPYRTFPWPVSAAWQRTATPPRLTSNYGLRMETRVKRLALFITLSLAGASAAESPAVVDANGAILGSYIGSTGPRYTGGVSVPTSMLDVISPTGYLFSVFQQSGDVANSFRVPGVQAEALWATLYFESADCTGQAYVDTTQAPDVVVMGGFVFNRKSAVHPGLWFSPKTSVSTEISYGSAVSPKSL